MCFMTVRACEWGAWEGGGEEDVRLHANNCRAIEKKAKKVSEIV